MRSALFLFTALPALLGTSCSGQKAASSNPGPARVLEATVERTIPGRPEGRKEQVYMLTLRWSSSEKPVAFVLQTGRQWLEGSLQWISRPGIPGRQSPPGSETMTVQDGDTLGLVAYRQAGKHLVTATRQTNDTALFIKTNNSHWHRVTIGSINRKPDTEMP